MNFSNVLINLLFNISLAIYQLFISDPAFVLLSLVILLTALFTILEQNMARAIVYLTASFASIGFLFFFLNSPFLAISQILIYSIGITLLLLFAIMLVQGLQEEKKIQKSMKSLVSSIASISLFILLSFCILASSEQIYSLQLFKKVFIENGYLDPSYDLQLIGQTLLKENLLAFELISIMLLVIFIGAIIIATRKNRHI